MTTEETYLLNSTSKPASEFTIADRFIAVGTRIQTSFRKASAWDLISIAIAVFLTIGGITGQTLALNFWLQPFRWSNGGGPFTVLSSIATFTSLCFCFALAALTLRGRNGAMFMFRPKPLLLTAVLGFFNASNGVLIVFATGNTPEQYQAILLSAQVVVTFIFMCIFVPSSTRSFAALFGSPATIILLVSFVCCIGGIFVGLIPQLQQGAAGDAGMVDPQQWTLVYATAMIPGGLYNVAASYYLRTFTLAPEIDVEESVQSDANYVKFAMLGLSAVFQLLFMFVLFPLDWAPWFGTTHSPHESALALTNGWKCIFGGCKDNAPFFVAFLCSYMAQYLGTAVLNKYSSTFTSMMTQVGSPVTTIFLLAIPSLRVTPGPLAVGPTVGAVVLLTLAALTYFLWEEAVRLDDSEMEVIISNRNAGGADGAVSVKFVDGSLSTRPADA